MERTEATDVVVVGGGPAGLSAALTLGRGRKKVLLCDAGPPRNAAAEHMQTFLSRDGTPPRELRRIGREQLRPYDVEVRDVRVLGLERIGPRFRVALEGGGVVSADKRALLARTGVRLEERRIRRLVPSAEGHALEAVELEDGTRVPRAFLFARPPQRQVPFVQRLGLALDEQGYVKVSAQQETSLPGIYAGGDLTTPIQGAMLAAAAGMLAASMANHGLNLEAIGVAHG